MDRTYHHDLEVLELFLDNDFVNTSAKFLMQTPYSPMGLRDLLV
jgi:hypothetical protein